MENNISPLPWKLNLNANCIHTDNATEFVIMTLHDTRLSKGPSESEATYIVKSANAYPKLVEALKALTDKIERKHDSGYSPEYEIAKNLLTELE